jgi:hypothetical protein
MKVKIGILTTLAVLVLFGFTFSSCKACDKKNKPVGSDDKVSDTKTSSDTTGSGEDSSSATGSDSQPNPTPALTQQQLAYMAKAKAELLRAEAALEKVKVTMTFNDALNDLAIVRNGAERGG